MWFLIWSVGLGITCDVSSKGEVIDLSRNGDGVSGLMVAFAIDYHVYGMKKGIITLLNILR